MKYKTTFCRIPIFEEQIVLNNIQYENYYIPSKMFNKGANNENKAEEYDKKINSNYQLYSRRVNRCKQLEEEEIEDLKKNIKIIRSNIKNYVYKEVRTIDNSFSIKEIENYDILFKPLKKANLIDESSFKEYATDNDFCRLLDNLENEINATLSLINKLKENDKLLTSIIDSHLEEMSNKGWSIKKISSIYKGIQSSGVGFSSHEYGSGGWGSGFSIIEGYIIIWEKH